MRAHLLMHVCTSAVHFLLLERVFGLSFFTTECVSQGMVPSSGSVGWPIIVCPYRDSAGQPLAIWRGSLVCWLASHLDRSTHTQQPPPRRPKTEALFSMLAEGGLWSRGAPDFTVLQASYAVPLEAKEPQRVSYLKMPQKKALDWRM